MKRRVDDANGFEEWGGYMEMKKQKLQEQFLKDAENFLEEKDDLFKGIAIFVNGFTDPSADELRNIMMQHGGIYHHYYRTGKTTHVIASNLPDCKIKQTQGIKVVKPTWITDSIKENKVLDYRDYLLFSNQSKSQPSIKSLMSPLKSDISKNSGTKTASDGQFLSEFYNNSRLHHISTMGSIFKQYINDLRSDKNYKFTGRDKLREINQNKKISSDDQVEEIDVSTNKVIMHIDMDCFFVSVGIRDRPELKGVPVAVTHAKGNRAQPSAHLMKELEAYQNKGIILEADKMNEMDSMSEIASCSYEARAAGVKNGMFLGQALKLCPTLKPIPYDFDSYKEVSYTLYNTVTRYTLDIEAVSCDEMYVDCTQLLSEVSMAPLEFADVLRSEVKKGTRCPCSVGFGANRLQARIATKKAKPDGQFYLQEDPETFFESIPVSDLPGVGYSTSYKLKSMGVNTCGDLQKLSIQKLQHDFGNKLGTTLYKCSRGIDDKELVFHQVRKSVSADVNYGIRFQNDEERNTFLKQLSEEVSRRIDAIKMKSKCITLKLMVRHKDAPEETAKFLGHGMCEYVTKSSSLADAVSDAYSIYKEVSKIITKLKIDSKELRGIGIQLTRLESCNESKNNGLLKFLEKSKQQLQDSSGSKSKENRSTRSVPANSRPNCVKKLDLSFSQVDQSFLNAMPEEIRKEIMWSLKGSNKHKYGNKSTTYNTAKPEEKNIEKPKETPEGNADTCNSYVSLGELKSLLEEWVCNEETPLLRDLSLISNYLQELVVARYLQELSIILKYFHRYIKRYNKAEKWKNAYSMILEDIQGKMLAVYNGKLVIAEEFTHF